jgi:hypothetical protein
MVVVESILPNTLTQIVSGFTLTAVASYFSYRFLEKPFMGLRANNLQSIRLRTRLAGISSALVVLGLLGAQSAWSNYGVQEFEGSEGVLQGDTTEIGFATYLNSILDPCPNAIATANAFVGDTYSCYQNSKDSNLDFLVLGNSHAAHLIPGLLDSEQELKIRFYPFSGGFRIDNPEMAMTLRIIESDGVSSAALILNSFWEIKKLDTLGISQIINSTKTTVKGTYFFDDVPNFKITPQRCKYSELFLIPAPCSEDLPGFSAHVEKLDEQLRSSFPQSQIVKSSSFFLEKDARFSLAAPPFVLFRDQNHLNADGSRLLFEHLRQTGSFPK